MRCFPISVPILVTVALLHLAAGSTDDSFVNVSSYDGNVSTEEPYVNTSADDVTRFIANDSYVNVSSDYISRFTSDYSYVNISIDDVTNITTDDSYVNVSSDYVSSFTNDDTYVNVSSDYVSIFTSDYSYENTTSDDAIRLQQAAAVGACDNLRQCQNGGICTPKDGHHFCDCLPGTSGDLCEIVDECVRVDDKCKDGSKCAYDVELVKATCQCEDPNLKYDSVEEKCKRTCDEDAMCKNGGLCMHRGDYLFCHCKAGTSGTFCERIEDVDKCVNVCGVRQDKKDGSVLCSLNENGEPQCSCREAKKKFDEVLKICRETCISDFFCENGGTCETRTSGKFCKCLPGSEGDFCESVPACNVVDCGEDAQCVLIGNPEQIGEVKCQCKDYELTFDVLDKTCKDPCENYTCYNDGKCAVSNDKPQCVCKIPFYGERCELGENDACKNFSCENGGNCTSVEGMPVCKCRPPFYGKRCELGGGDPCETYHCENGGRCRTANNRPECVCPRPFYGARCELGGKDEKEDKKDKNKDKPLYPVIWIMSSVVILLIPVIGCLIAIICRKK